MDRRQIASGWLAFILLSVFPVSSQAAGSPVATQRDVSITVQTQPLSVTTPACSGTFVAHDLDHTDTVSATGGISANVGDVQQFEANGGGVAINDLNNDGLLDIVLANQAGKDTILWNEGGLNFRTERLPFGDSRAVTIVDVDGDGWQDIVVSRTKTAPAYWRNDGSGHFTQEFLSGVGKPLYAINWADVDNDGTLDLIGATYDASLLVDLGNEFQFRGDGGVYVYPNNGGQFSLTALATSSQALALALLDLNGDGRRDIWVGDDFDTPDQLFYRTDTGWQAVQPLTTMSHSTMSLDYGDLNNDGRISVFSTDMRPYDSSAETRRAWAPITRQWLADPRRRNDPQVNANVLQTVGDFTDWAQAAGVSASGWSWSGKFGDLDQDGFLDLYVVNGFMEATTFANLPNHELVEANQAFRNTGGGQFTTMPGWGLGSLRSGRGMSMADLDGDGDLDMVVNNLLTPAQLFENQLCTGNSLQMDLFWPGSGNSRAIGATLALHTDQGVYSRDVRAASGYISGDPARIHFGIPDGARLEQLDIRWPDGAISTMDAPAVNSVLSVTRGRP